MMSRKSTSGFALLSTLVLLLLVTAIAFKVQSHGQTSQHLFARLTTDLHDRAAHDALTDRLRGLLGDAMASAEPLPGRPRLDGTPFDLEWAGQRWQSRTQDVEGLIDLYLTAPEVFEDLLGTSRRNQALANLPPGARFPTPTMSLANFEFDPLDVQAFVTQSGRTGTLRIGTMSKKLRLLTGPLLPGPRDGDQITRVALSFDKNLE